jgi:hypothetical protein
MTPRQRLASARPANHPWNGSRRSDSTASRAMTIMRKLFIVLLVSLAIGGGVAVLVHLFPGHNQESYKRVVTLSDDSLLAVSRPRDNRTTTTYGPRACARLSLLRLDGTIERTVDDCNGWIRLAGLGDGVAWLNSSDRGLHARRLGDLSLVPSIEEAIAAHPILSRPGRGNHKANVMGMHEGQVVLEGADQRLYTVASNGTIEQREKNFVYQRRGSNENSSVPEAVVLGKVSVTRDSGTMMITDLDGIIQPRIVVRDGLDDPVMLEDPESVILVSMDLVGPSGRQQLSRVTLDNEVLWTTTIRDLAGPIDLGRPPSYRTVWVDVIDGALWAIIEASVRVKSSDGDTSRRFGARLVRIDPHTGRSLAVHEITKQDD